MKSAATRGRPFQKGHDSRRGRGPRKGAPNAGRPPDEFKAALAALVSREETLAALEAILRNPDHPHFIQALRYASDRGYGLPTQSLKVEDEGPAVVIVAPEKRGAEEWMRKDPPQHNRTESLPGSRAALPPPSQSMSGRC